MVKEKIMTRNIELQTGHVGLNVSNADVSSRFYQSVFGLSELGRSDAPGRRYVFLGYHGKVVVTIWQQSSGEFQKDRPGLHHFAFQVANVEELREIEARLREQNARFLYEGIVPHAEGSHSGGLYFEDPDGIRLEVAVPEGAQAYHAPHSDAPSCGFF
jgi:catechol-2,3-dioxygenase